MLRAKVKRFSVPAYLNSNYSSMSASALRDMTLFTVSKPQLESQHDAKVCEGHVSLNRRDAFVLKCEPLGMSLARMISPAWPHGQCSS